MVWKICIKIRALKCSLTIIWSKWSCFFSVLECYLCYNSTQLNVINMCIWVVHLCAAPPRPRRVQTPPSRPSPFPRGVTAAARLPHLDRPDDSLQPLCPAPIRAQTDQTKGLRWAALVHSVTLMLPCAEEVTTVLLVVLCNPVKRHRNSCVALLMCPWLIRSSTESGFYTPNQQVRSHAYRDFTWLYL